MNVSARFDYSEAFGRQIGVLREEEQDQLRTATVALAGLGGAGGAHLAALLRLGVGRFHLADPDRFELANFSRQWGATIDTVGRNKAEAMAEMAARVNPEVRLRVFPEGVTAANLGDFLDGADLVIDAIDFFGLDPRRLLMAECRRRGLTVLLASPAGFGASVVVFPPVGDSFDEHFGLRDGMTRLEHLLAFAVGVGYGLSEDVDLARVDLVRETGPAVGTACLLAAAMTATEAVKLMARRGPAPTGPYGVHFDPLRGRTVVLGKVPGLVDSAEGRAIREAFLRRMPGLGALLNREHA